VNREDILVDMTQSQQLLHDSQFRSMPRWVRFMIEHLLTAGRTDLA